MARMEAASRSRSAPSDMARIIREQLASVVCHSERSEESALPSSLVIPSKARNLLFPGCLSFRAKRGICSSFLACHSEQSEESAVSGLFVIPSAARNLLFLL